MRGDPTSEAPGAVRGGVAEATARTALLQKKRKNTQTAYGKLP